MTPIETTKAFYELFASGKIEELMASLEFPSERNRVGERGRVQHLREYNDTAAMAAAVA